MAPTCAVVTAAVGASVLAGWALHVPLLLTWFPGYVTLKANTALAFVLAGTALFSRSRPCGAITRWAGRVGALLTIVIGAVTLVEYLFDTCVGVDELLFREAVVKTGTSHAGRMAPNTALAFVLMGAALWATPATSRRGRQFVEACAFLTLLLALIAFVGYVYGAHVLVGLFARTRMAVHTLVVLSVGTLFVRPEEGLAAELLAPGPGGVVARRLLPVALVVPTTVGIVCLTGYRAGLYDPAFAAGIMTVAETVSFGAMVLMCARFLSEGERARTLASVDELTGLLNRRAFLARAGTCARRSHAGGLLFFVDLDGLKEINDRLGHAAGDAAIVDMASVLRSVFREGDIIARLGGDEFAVLAPCAILEHMPSIVNRLEIALERSNAQPRRPFELSCSTGVVAYESDASVSIDDLLKTADAQMYLTKQEKKRSRRAPPAPTIAAI